MNTNYYKNQIKRYYGERRSNGSQVLLINHIYEGLTILTELNAERSTKDAYAVHPMFQSDLDLEANYKKLLHYEPIVTIKVLEYRSSANSWLSIDFALDTKDRIVLSPISGVNQMLIADKVQNRKDFELYHKDKHPRSEILERYFNQWLQRLGITEERYQELIKLIS
jgi:hypothetical protein